MMNFYQTGSWGAFQYTTDGGSPGDPVLADGSAVYTPGLSEHRATGSSFYHADGLGSTRGLTNSSGSITDYVAYDAFGEVIGRTGTTSTPALFAGKEGYQSDSASGLMLLGYRYYDPSIGRFLSSDPAQAGTNWYAYCENNPLVRVDPSGLSWKKVLEGSAAAIMVTALCTIAIGFFLPAAGLTFIGGVILGAIVGALAGIAGYGYGTEDGNLTWNGIEENAGFGALTGGAVGGLSGVGVLPWVSKLIPKAAAKTMLDFIEWK